MCVIIHLPAKVSMDFEKLKNACYNNWHSYGLVTRIGDKLDIRRVVPDKGEIDPQEVMGCLEDDIEYERFLHLRHNTAGATNIENCHPFDIYYSKGRQVVFMHNGTFNEYVSKMVVNTKVVDDPDGPSDTKNFVDEVIIPTLAAQGGDLSHKYVRKVINKFWSGSNRGVLISSDQDPWFIDTWKEIDCGGTKIKVSNDSYFDKVIRGPEHERQEAKRKEKEGKKIPPLSRFRSSSSLTVSPLKNFQFDVKPDYGKLTKSMKEIFDDYDIWDREHAVALGLCTRDELKTLQSDEDTCVTLMDWVFTDYLQLHEEHLALEEKISKMQSHLDNMAAKLKASGEK